VQNQVVPVFRLVQPFPETISLLRVRVVALQSSVWSATNLAAWNGVTQRHPEPARVNRASARNATDDFQWLMCFLLFFLLLGRRNHTIGILNVTTSAFRVHVRVTAMRSRHLEDTRAEKRGMDT
jgi:hypothetical protein